MGPSNTRDGFGVVADFAMHPLTWFLGPTNFLLYSIYGGGQGISTREEALPQLTALREGSIDYYAALRNAYYQNRQSQIWARRADRRNDWTED
jgi:phospholipid-binding lipoprotein MlaA